MTFRVRASLCIASFLLVNCLGSSYAQRPVNSNSIYQQLRNLLPGPEVIVVNNLELRRDAATFTFRHGSFALYGEVNGKMTGAMFKGEGHFHLTPPSAEERHNMSILNHHEEFDEDFDEVVFRFTDATAAELRKGSTGKGTLEPSYGQAGQKFNAFLRVKLQSNLDLRLLEDVLSPVQGGFFLAAMHGSKDAHLIFTLDPHGAGELAPEEVSLLNWSDWGKVYPAAFHLKPGAAQAGSNGQQANQAFSVDNEDLDISIEKNGFLSGLAKVHLVALQDGVAVLPLALYPTLRVSRVETEKGESLDFVQEKKEEDADFGVVLAQPLKKGDAAVVRIAYGGKDVVLNKGGLNYYPVEAARDSWYPSAGFGSYATYHMVFHVPKNLEVIATGTKVSEKADSKGITSEWKTDMPLAVAGFNLGQFKMKEATVGNLTVDAYANSNSSDDMQFSEDAALGIFNPAKMLPVELSQGQVAAQIYTNFFGPLPFTRVALTQQSACNYGQSWPMLVFLPSCSFLDSTQQHGIGVNPADLYWRVVTPHEVAHQWWGQTVGFRSYRDQWMSEGFADASASIFLQLTRPKPNEFQEFWKQARKLLTEKNAEGFRPIDVGPVTMGIRLSNHKTGFDVYQNLVYPKGAYILHMIRMMMWSAQDGDARFMATMHDFVETYRLKTATTEDFKAIVEKHMSPGMNIDGNGRMDWFFDEYVYGTELPNYHLTSQITSNGETASAHFTLTQSGVLASFKMLVPIYLELADGRVIHLGLIHLVGSSSFENTMQLPKLPSEPKRVLVNYNYDVLATED